MNYLIQLKSPNSNITHFLYQSYQPYLEFILNNPKAEIYMNHNILRKLPEYQRNLMELSFNKFNVINMTEPNSQCKIIKIEPTKPYYKSDIFKIIRKMVYDKYNIIDTPLEIKYKVLYIRNEKQNGNKIARRILNYEVIQHHFDFVLHSIVDLSFEEQIRLFSRISHLVCPEGSHLGNVIFMNKKCKILAIVNTGVFYDHRILPYDCWQKTFGGDEFVEEINTNIIATKLVKSNIPEAPWYHRYNDHIYVDEFLSKKIKNWFSRNN